MIFSDWQSQIFEEKLLAAKANRGVVMTLKTSEMEGFAKIINEFQPLLNVSKLSILDVWGKLGILLWT